MNVKKIKKAQLKKARKNKLNKNNIGEVFEQVAKALRPVAEAIKAAFKNIENAIKEVEEVTKMKPKKGVYAIYKGEQYSVYAKIVVPRATYYSIRKGIESNLRVREELLIFVDEAGARIKEEDLEKYFEETIE